MPKIIWIEDSFIEYIYQFLISVFINKHSVEAKDHRKYLLLQNLLLQIASYSRY